MATTQTVIAATGSNSIPVAQNTTRRQLYIKCYANQPGTTTPQTGVMYIAFGKPATLGTAGELELLPGSEYIFGGPLPPRVANLPHGFILPNCPTESINVIATMTMVGAVMEQQG